MLRAIIRYLRKGSHGQDLAEYCLITALVALVGLGIFLYMSGGIQNIWTSANTHLGAGNAASRAGSGAGAAH